jgi:tRNA (guanine37-N1)-methyltransferase
VPGVMGNQASGGDESFADGLLEYPQYTRPAEFRGMAVPEVLRGGHHGEIARWRRDQAVARTRAVRPDLYEAWLAGRDDPPT